MAKRRMGIMLLLLCMCLGLLSAGVQEVSAASISPQRDCSLALTYGYGELLFGDVPVELYQIADVSADLQYTLTVPFGDSGVQLNGIQSQGEWNVVRNTLESYILAKGITPDTTSRTDQNGQVSFASLKPGLYLVPAVYVEQEDLACAFDAALVALPGIGSDGEWQYQVEVICKPEQIPPVGGDEVLDWKVLKLWKGDSGKKDRPKSIIVEIFRNGELFETVTLSEETDWSYSWSARDDGSNWMVVERDVPLGYTGALEERDNTFVLTNTRIPEKTDDPTPETGDSTNLSLYLLLMCVSAGVLISLIVAGKRKRL